MSEEKKTPVEQAMEKDCIILVTVNEALTAMIDNLSYPYPGWFEKGEEGAKISINTKCRGAVCAQYNEFANRCGLK
uniref:Uncharacterized protein n=1 Tax=viral metagenome TaxID=1070528 RepID=A0A6M3M6Y2_9ZZZZ